MSNEKKGFFSGIKKIVFKDEQASEPQNQTQNIVAGTEEKVQNAPVKTYDVIVPPSAKEDAAKRAYQLIEAINQPGVDFFEVWNAVEENGGAQSGNLKQAFNTLKYADKTLTKEKLINSGNYYKTELNKALDADIQKKNDERNAIENKIKQSKTALSTDVDSIQTEIKKLQKELDDKKAQLSNLDSQLQPKLTEINQKIQSGKQAIEGVISKMQALIDLAEKEL